MKRVMLRRVVAPSAIVAGSLVVLLSAVILGVSITGLRLFPPFGGRAQLGGKLDGAIALPPKLMTLDVTLGGLS